MNIKEFRRARWQLRRDFNLLIRETIATMQFRLDSNHLEHLRGIAWNKKTKESSDRYARYAKKYWCRWGG